MTDPDLSNNQKHKVTWLAVDDWSAIYVDGVLIGEQNHSLSPWTLIEVFEALGAEVEDLRYEPIAEELVEDLGRFPEEWVPEFLERLEDNG